MLCVEQLKYIIVLYTSYHKNNICRSRGRRQPSVCTVQETPLVRFNFWWKYLWESLKTFKNFRVLIEHRAFVTHKKKCLARLGNIYLRHGNLKIQLRNKTRIACDYRVRLSRDACKTWGDCWVFYMHLECRYNSIITQRLKAMLHVAFSCPTCVAK